MDASFSKNIKQMREKTEMIAELKELVKPYIQDQQAFDNLNEDTDFINDLKINSANLVDVILDIEEKFDLEIDNESMDKMLNVKAAMEVINTKISEKQCQVTTLQTSKKPNELQTGRDLVFQTKCFL